MKHRKCGKCGKVWYCMGCGGCVENPVCVKCWAKTQSLHLKKLHGGSCFPNPKSWRIA